MAWCDEIWRKDNAPLCQITAEERRSCAFAGTNYGCQSIMNVKWGTNCPPVEMLVSDYLRPVEDAGTESQSILLGCESIVLGWEATFFRNQDNLVRM